MKTRRPKIGFVVNPIAGMGGRVGLKGTDGEEILRKALELGATPVAPARAESALEILVTVKDALQLVTYPHAMGEDEARKCGFNPTVFRRKTSGNTTPIDTKEAVAKMLDAKVDLIMFVGGDGTARNVYEVVRETVPVVGVPAGVKIHSSVFAVNPEAAATMAIRFLWGGLPLRESEVMDIDEDAFRDGRVSARLYGYMVTPYEPTLIQGTKIASTASVLEVRNQAAVAVYIIEEMKPDIIYILGPGTTTRTVADLLDEGKTLLGVDLFYNKKLISQDVNEAEIISAIEGKTARIIVTPIGGQGFIFGRGNLQVSPKIIRAVGRDNITVIATKNKMSGLETLRVDTGDHELDDLLRGDLEILIDYGEKRLIKVE